MNVLIAGGTGFVGKHVTKQLVKQGHHVYILTRTPDTFDQTNEITYLDYNYDIKELPFIEAVINLAGDSLFGYWTAGKKESILKSRVETTQRIIDMMKQMEPRPNVFISGSAVGFYGVSDEVIFTEKTTDPGNDFLADVVVKWEETAKQAEELNIRTVYARFGIILGKEGSLPLMSMPVKLFMGGKIGNGEQWISWIHIEDVASLLIYCLANEQLNGAINFTTPNPQRNKDFMKTIAKVIKRPYWFPTPAPLVRLAAGEMSMLITEGQYVLPSKALTHNYEFIYPNLHDALEDALV